MPHGKKSLNDAKIYRSLERYIRVELADRQVQKTKRIQNFIVIPRDEFEQYAFDLRVKYWYGDSTSVGARETVFYSTKIGARFIDVIFPDFELYPRRAGGPDRTEDDIVFDTHPLFSSMYGQLDTGKLDEMISKMADFYRGFLAVL